MAASLAFVAELLHVMTFYDQGNGTLLEMAEQSLSSGLEAVRLRADDTSAPLLDGSGPHIYAVSLANLLYFLLVQSLYGGATCCVTASLCRCAWLDHS